MKGFSNELLDILRLLENYPLESYSDLAKKIGVSTQTFSRRFEELRNKGIVRDVHSSLNPESMQLERYIVIFITNTIEEIESLELACDFHPYTSSRNRIFASEFGLFTIFDVPSGSSENLILFFEALRDGKYCNKYSIYKSQGKRIFYSQPLQGNITDIDDFDLRQYLLQEVSEKNGENQGRETKPSSLEFHPIQLLILRDVTSDMRIPMSNLLEKYKTYLNIPEKEVSFFSLPKGFRPHLEQFFSKKRSENAIYIDFKKKYHKIVETHIDSYWLGVNRKFFEIFTRFAYIINNIPIEEKKRLFNLFNNNRPPFYIYVEDLGRDVVISTSLPPFHQTEFSYFMKARYERFSTYLLDSFGYNAVKYRFYVHNYDFDNQTWKNNREWMFENPIKELEETVSQKKKNKVISITK